jgi:hypothetical protein
MSLRNFQTCLGSSCSEHASTARLTGVLKLGRVGVCAGFALEKLIGKVDQRRTNSGPGPFAKLAFITCQRGRVKPTD